MIRRQVLSLLVSICAISGVEASAAEPFPMETYTAKCGGKIYSKCDSAELNQETIFEAARAEAIANGRQIFLVVGADWCPSCNYFAKMIKNDPDAAKFHDRFTFVELNGELSSTRALAKKLNISYVAYPQAFLFNPETRVETQQFYPSRFGTIGQLLAVIGVQGDETAATKPVSASRVFMTTLEKPIDLNNSYGDTKMIAEPKTDAEKMLNQGVAALQVYHYVDAYRSFKMVEKEDPSLAMAYAGEAVAMMNLTGGTNYFYDYAIRKMREQASLRPLSQTEQSWLDFIAAIKLAHADNYVLKPGESLKSLEGAYQEVMADKSNLESQSLATWIMLGNLGYEKGKSVFSAMLQQDPNNIGAHHALLHIAESQNDARAATEHAVVLAKLAPNSAHAQHMLGHTLPQQGRWQEALDQFLKADAIHHAWSKKYDLPLDQDWHYAHNADCSRPLMSVSVNTPKLARLGWLRARVTIARWNIPSNSPSLRPTKKRL